MSRRRGESREAKRWWLRFKRQNAGFEVYIRRGKMLLALKCLIAAKAIDPEQGVLHEQLVRFRQACEFFSSFSVSGFRGVGIC